VEQIVREVAPEIVGEKEEDGIDDARRQEAQHRLDDRAAEACEPRLDRGADAGARDQERCYNEREERAVHQIEEIVGPCGPMRPDRRPEETAAEFSKCCPPSAMGEPIGEKGEGKGTQQEGPPNQGLVVEHLHEREEHRNEHPPRKIHDLLNEIAAHAPFILRLRVFIKGQSRATSLSSFRRRGSG